MYLITKLYTKRYKNSNESCNFLGRSNRAILDNGQYCKFAKLSYFWGFFHIFMGKTSTYKIRNSVHCCVRATKKSIFIKVRKWESYVCMYLVWLCLITKRSDFLWFIFLSEYEHDFRLVSECQISEYFMIAFLIQLNEYETAPYIIQLSQNLTTDCLLI